MTVHPYRPSKPSLINPSPNPNVQSHLRHPIAGFDATCQAHAPAQGTTYLYKLMLTLGVAVLVQLAFGEDAAAAANRKIIRYNGAQLSELILVRGHLLRPIFSGDFP